MGCGSSSDRDMDEDVTKGERLDAPDAVKNAPQKPSNKKQQEKYERGKRTIDLSGTILEKPGDVRDYYTFDKVLGKGSFGVVHLVQEITTKLPYACKSISKKKLLTPEDVEDVKREVQIMMHLGGHPNVVQMYGAFEDKSYIHLIMELCSGGELFERIAEDGHFSEKVAAEYCRTIVSVVNHCHSMNVIHRDLKPENFLFSAKGPTGVLKATDFGLSRFFTEGKSLSEMVGSPYYIAPEVLKNTYGKEADIWSCGVILYILLCGWPPFQGDSTPEIFRSIMARPLDLKTDVWHKISDAAKDCVKRMLCRDVTKRMTAAQILKHPWMKANGVASDEAMTPEVLTRLRQYGRMNNFKKEALKIVAKALPSQEIIGIREMFKAIDKDGSGCITIDELRQGLKTKGAELNAVEVERIVDQIDVNGNHLIDYEEFLAATIHLSKLNKEELLMEAFEFFDKDGSGFITLEELNQALKDTGADNADAKAVLEAADKNSDGKVDYGEFCDMMRNHEFEQLVKAKAALKTHVFIVDTKRFSEDSHSPPEDLAYDEIYTTKSMAHLGSGGLDEESLDVSSTPEPGHKSKEIYDGEIQPAAEHESKEIFEGEIQPASP